MKFPEIVLDNESFELPLDVSITIIELVSVVDQALVSSGRRVSSVKSQGKEFFNPQGTMQKCSLFESLEIFSEPIPPFKNLKRAVVTLCIGEKYESMRAVSEPTFKAYATKCAADYICIDTEKVKMKTPHFEKWQMFDMLFEYDRILFIDSDILVSTDTPDLFAMLPYDHLCGFYEDTYQDRSGMIRDTQKFLGDIDWHKGYLNSGFGLYSWIHRPVFRKPDGRYVVGAYEQNEYNYRIVKSAYKVCSLPYHFNHMDMCGDDFTESYIIHYAGKGFTGVEDETKVYDAKVELMLRDWSELSQRAKSGFRPLGLMLIDDQKLSLNKFADQPFLAAGPGVEAEGATEESKYTLLPMCINHQDDSGEVYKDTPLGDLLFTIPVAREAGMNIYIPRTFVGDLVYNLLEDKSGVCRDLTVNTPVCQIVSQLLGTEEAVFHARKWGDPSLAEGFGKMNVTESIAAALGVRVENPAFSLERPVSRVDGRVILFPKGSTEQRSLTSSYAEQIINYLKFKGYETLVGDQKYDDPVEYAKFVASAEYVIAVSTGPQHLAAAMGIKTVGLPVASPDWAYNPNLDHVKILKSSCSRCWYESAKEWLCEEELPLCMREHTPVDILMAMKELDEIQAKKEAGTSPAL